MESHHEYHLMRLGDMQDLPRLSQSFIQKQEAHIVLSHPLKNQKNRDMTIHLHFLFT